MYNCIVFVKNGHWPQARLVGNALTGVDELAMARRTKAEADETRTKLLDAAEQVFFEKGVARASLNEIAQRAGATRGAVYWHFKDKVDVFTSMLSRICMPFEELCDDKYQELAPLERIRKSIYAVFDSMDGDERRRKVFDTALFKLEYVGELESVREGHVESFEFSQRKFASDLARAAQELGVQMPMSPEDAALGLHSLFVGLIHGWVLTGGNFPLRQIGAVSVEAYLSGLGLPGQALGRGGGVSLSRSHGGKRVSHAIITPLSKDSMCMRGCSSVDRVLASEAKGRGFDPRQPRQRVIPDCLESS